MDFGIFHDVKYSYDKLVTNTLPTVLIYPRGEKMKKTIYSAMKAYVESTLSDVPNELISISSDSSSETRCLMSVFGG